MLLSLWIPMKYLAVQNISGDLINLYTCNSVFPHYSKVQYTYVDVITLYVFKIY